MQGCRGWWGRETVTVITGFPTEGVAFLCQPLSSGVPGRAGPSSPLPWASPCRPSGDAQQARPFLVSSKGFLIYSFIYLFIYFFKGFHFGVDLTLFPGFM